MRLTKFSLSIGSVNNDKETDSAKDQVTGSIQHSGDVLNEDDVKAFITLRDEKNSETDSYPSQGNYGVMLPQNFKTVTSQYFNITGSLSAATDPNVNSSLGATYAHGDVLVIAETVE